MSRFLRQHYHSNTSKYTSQRKDSRLRPPTSRFPIYQYTNSIKHRPSRQYEQYNNELSSPPTKQCRRSMRRCTNILPYSLRSSANRIRSNCPSRLRPANRFHLCPRKHEPPYYHNQHSRDRLYIRRSPRNDSLPSRSRQTKQVRLRKLSRI